MVIFLSESIFIKSEAIKQIFALNCYTAQDLTARFYCNSSIQINRRLICILKEENCKDSLLITKLFFTHELRTSLIRETNG